MTLKWIIKENKAQIGKVIALSLFGVVNAVLGVYLALVLRKTIDAAVAKNMPIFEHWVKITFFVIIALVVFRFTIFWLEEHARVSTENALKCKMLDVIFTRKYSSIASYHTGELMNRLNNDVTTIANSFISLLPALVSMLVKLLSVITVLFFLDYRFAFAFFGFGVVIIIISALFRKKMKYYHTRVQEETGKTRSFLQESLENTIVIKAFFAKNAIEKENENNLLEYKKMRMKKNVFSNVLHTGFGALMNFGFLFGIVWCGYGIIKGDLTYGTLFAVWQLIGQLQAPLGTISAVIPQYYAMLASAQRLIEIVELEEYYEEKQENPQFAGIFGNDITMSYKEDLANVLEATHFNIKKGEFIAISGTSGIGKSTLIKLLLGLYPLKNGEMCMLLDDGTKQPMNHSLFSYVPQGNALMSGSIAKVVSMYKEELTDADYSAIKEACKLACADTFIELLPQDYDRVLGEKGLGLSEGQMQRIAIARALYHNAPVILLDEATSALDEATELKVLENIKTLTDKTIIIITHRKAAFSFCDRTITLTDKKIVEVEK
ncbi:MAG: ABC transporter ATP-binding protein [Lachnospiraceae bacterium]|nr:ABC transporter ATP-binding protein [Lachnospiraceae bacterium]